MSTSSAMVELPNTVGLHIPSNVETRLQLCFFRVSETLTYLKHQM